MLFFTFLLIDKQIFAPMFGVFGKKSYLCTAIRKKWRFRLGVRTHASHAWNTGSIPVVATIQSEENKLFSSDFVLPPHSTTPIIILQKAQNTTKSDSVPYLLPFNPYACVSITDSSRSVEGCRLYRRTNRLSLVPQGSEHLRRGGEAIGGRLEKGIFYPSTGYSHKL